MSLTDTLRLIDLLLTKLWILDDNEIARTTIIQALRFVSKDALDTWGEKLPRETVNDIPF